VFLSELLPNQKKVKITDYVFLSELLPNQK